MKMAELDAQRRSTKACVQILTLLEVVIEEVVFHRKQPANFNDMQFQMFDITRATGASYVECREIVECSSQLLFSFRNASSDLALQTLQHTKEMMYSDDTPSAIQFFIFGMLASKIDKYYAEHIVASVATFVQQFIIDDEEDLIYR